MNHRKFQNILSWFKERFPIPHALLAGAVYMKVDATLRHLDFGTIRGIALTLSGIGSTVLFFLLIRIIDEHKDFKKDALSHPERVLQRGLITLHDLRLVGVLCVMQITLFTLVSSSHRFEGLTALCALLAWTALMSYDFNIENLSSKRPVFYGLSHLFVTVMIVGWITATLSRSSITVHYAATVGAVALYILLASAALEVTRKAFVTQENLTEGDSYSRVFGFKRSVILAGSLSAAATTVDVVIFLGLDLPMGIFTSLCFGFGSLSFLSRYYETEDVRFRKLAVTMIGFQLIASSVTTAVPVLIS